MKTTELIEFLTTHEFTDTQAYNLLVSDLFDFIPLEQVEASQRLVLYFKYKIEAVLLPSIRELKQRVPV